MSVMSITEAIGRLRVFEENLKGRQDRKEEEEQVMLTRAQWEALSIKENKGSEGSGSGHGYSQGSGRGNDKRKRPYRKFDKSKIKCFNCSEYGHFASECRQSKKEKVFVAKKGDDEPALLMLETCELMETKKETIGAVTLMEESVQLHLQVDEKDVWYLDTGASNHMTGCRKYFTDLDTSIRGTVRFGDGSAVSIGGQGTVLIEGRTGEHKALTDVYYILKLTSNIISLGQVEERGCKVMLEDDNLRVFDRKGQLLVQVERARNRLYILNLDLA